MLSPTVRLAPLTDADAEPTARWREAARANLRTPYVRSVEEQREFIRSLPAHRHEYRYWAVRVTEKAEPVTEWSGPILNPAGHLVGIAGLSPIEFENGLAEVSLVLDPAYIGQGHGGVAFDLILDEAFDHLRLDQVIAEAYVSNPVLGFWEHEAEKRGAYRTVLPKRKFSGGAYHDAIYFSFLRSGMANVSPPVRSDSEQERRDSPERRAFCPICGPLVQCSCNDLKA